MRKLSRIEGSLRSSSNLNVALAWARRGVPVLALWGVTDGQCDCGTANCRNPGKHPIGAMFPKGFKSATTKKKMLREIFSKYPNANVAIVPPDDLVVLDVDGPKGKVTFEELDVPKTATVMTGRGHHYYFHREDPPWPRVKNLPGVDIKGSNGYVVVPPSRHASGKQYRWSKGTKDLATLSYAVVRGQPNEDTNFEAKSLYFKEGGRNSSLARIAGWLRYARISPAAIRGALLAINKKQCRPPLNEDEVCQIAKSISRYATQLNDAFGNLSDIEEESVEWLFDPYIPRGTLTILDGDPGQGKSTFTSAIAAAVTNGKGLPFTDDTPEGNVLILSAEDDPGRVLKPRLRVNGANIDRIRIQQRVFTLDPAGLTLLRTEMESHHPLLVVIDPLFAYMEANTDLYRANEVMGFLVEIDQLAREFDAAILMVRHLTKSSADNPIYRGLGSIALTARVRSALILGRHPEDQEVRAVAHIKSSYAPEGPTITFELRAQEKIGPPTVYWIGSDPELTADEILTRPQSARGRPDTERETAKDFLLMFLDDGPMSKDAIMRAAEARNISEMTIRRAADNLGIIKRRVGKSSMWSLPKK